MFSFTEDVSTNQFTKYFGSAIILDINERENLALLKFEKNEEDFEVWAKSAISYQHKLVYGDSVLAAGENADEIYIIGLLNSLSSNSNRLISSSGSYVVINKNPNEEKILINSKDGEMIFEYDTNSGKSKINIQSGDLEFITNNGNISFTSGGNINFFSKQFIEMESQQGIRLSLKNMIGKLGISSFSINQRNIKLSSPALKILSQQADVQIEDSKY
ncbi:MAG TPA: hypothetical protein VLM39_01735, partial [Ignavibacteriaceae bacterium]|nr:hypothetical protein [Ignavibacteriaceae bacterium]